MATWGSSGAGSVFGEFEDPVDLFGDLFDDFGGISNGYNGASGFQQQNQQNQQQQGFQSTRDGVLFLIDGAEAMYARCIAAPNSAGGNVSYNGSNGSVAQGDRDDGEGGEASAGDSDREYGENGAQHNDKIPPIQAGLQFASQLLQDKIVSNEDHLISIVFYGTEKMKNPNQFPGVYIWQEMDVPDAQRILDVESAFRKPVERLEEELGHYDSSEHGAHFPFGDALWACSSIFNQCAAKLGFRRVFLFTSNDDPTGGDEQQREQIETRIKDLSDLGIEIHLFALNHPDRGFDMGRFWRQALSMSVHSEDPTDPAFDVTHDLYEKMDELLNDVRKKEFKKRSMLKLPFRIGPVQRSFDTPGPLGAQFQPQQQQQQVQQQEAPNLELALRLYCLVAPAKKGSPRWLHRETNEELVSVNKLICEKTGEVLLDSEIEFATEFGGQKLILTREALSQIKTVPGVSDNPGLRLLGFKPRSALKDYLNLRTSYFVYPDEIAIRGSTKLFAVLLDRMLVMDKIALATFCPRQGSMPRLCAMLPQPKGQTEDDLPSGMHLIVLPFADDVRKVVAAPIRDEERADDAAVDAAKALIRQLRLNFDFATFRNPALQTHYRYLQALALQRHDDVTPEDPYYGMAQDTRAFNRPKTLGRLNTFKERVFGDWKPPTKSKVPAVKRGGGGDGAQSKRRKKTDDEIRQSFANGELHKLTAVELKAFLSDHGLTGTSSLKKDDVVDKAHEFLLEERRKELARRAQSGEVLSDDDKKEPSPPPPVRHDQRKPARPQVADDDDMWDDGSVGDGDLRMGESSSDEEFRPSEKQARRDDEEEKEYARRLNDSASSLQHGAAGAGQRYDDESSETDDDFPSSHAQQSVQSVGSSVRSDTRPMCQFGMGCYRRNPQHFKEYAHPGEHPTASQFDPSF